MTRSAVSRMALPDQSAVHEFLTQTAFGHSHFLRLVEPSLLKAAIEKHRGQCASAARQLGLHRTTLRKKLDDYGITEG